MLSQRLGEEVGSGSQTLSAEKERQSKLLNDKTSETPPLLVWDNLVPLKANGNEEKATLFPVCPTDGRLTGSKGSGWKPRPNVCGLW